MRQFPKLYKIDNKGKIRIWWVEADGDKIRTCAGLQDGAITESEWKQMYAKNVGRANATTPEQQAIAEAEALHEKQLSKGGYHESLDTVATKKYIEPMLAETLDRNKFDGGQYFFVQPKFDGHRCIANADRLATRKGKTHVSVPHIHYALEPLFNDHPDLIIDGELYCHDLRDDFNELSSLIRKTKPSREELEKAEVIEYHVYDIVDPSLNFEQRIEKLQALISKYAPPKVIIAPTRRVASLSTLDDVYMEHIAAGYEGSMVRLNTYGYEIGKRSKSLLKYKSFQDEEFQIIDILSGEGNWAGYAKTVSVRSSDGIESSAGIKGNQQFTKQLLADREKYIGGTVTVKFFNKTPDGKPRFPVAIAFYPGERDL